MDKEDWKLDTLCDLYDTVTVAQAVIFANTKRKVDWLTNMMKSRDFAVSALVSINQELFTHDFFYVARRNDPS